LDSRLQIHVGQHHPNSGGYLRYRHGRHQRHLAHCIKEKKNWAKIVGIIMTILVVGNFPIGTVLGVLILIGIFDQTANSWFAVNQVASRSRAKQ